MSSQKVEVVISGNNAGLLSAFKGAGEATEAMAAQMETAISGVTSLLEKFAGPLMGIFGALAAGHFLKEAISETAQFGDELAKSSQMVGVSVKSLSGLAHAATISGVAFEDLTGGLAKLAKNMQLAVFTPSSPAAAAFKALGIQVTDASGHLRGTEDVLSDVAEKFSHMEDSAGKTALAMNIFGRSGKNLIPFLNEGREGLAELKAEADRLGISMSTQQAKAAEQYKDNLERLDAVVKGLKLRIGEELIPTLDELNSTLIEDGPHAISVLGVAAKSLVTAFKVIGFVISEVITVFITAYSAAWVQVSSKFQAFKLLLKGHFKEASQTVSDGMRDSHIALQAGSATLKKDWEELGLSLNKVWDPSLSSAHVSPRRGGSAAPNLEHPDKAAKAKAEHDKSEAEFERHLNAEQAAQVAHWKDMAAISMDALQQEELKINLSYTKKLETAKAAGASEEDMATIENARLAALQQARTDFEKKQAAERKKIAEQEAKEKQAFLEQYGTAEQGFMAGIEKAIQHTGTVFQQFAQASQRLLSGLENAFSGAIQGILSGTMTMDQAARSMVSGIVGSVAQMVSQLIAHWLLYDVILKAMGLNEGTTNAGRTSGALVTASAETWAAYAAIPFAGPILAAAQIEAMYASMAASTAQAATAGAPVKIPLAAEGAWFDRPTLAMIGEGPRPELVVPDVAFKDFASNLSANILAQERAAQGYGRQAAGYARGAAARSGVGGDAAPMMNLTMKMDGAVLLDGTQRGLRALGSLVFDGARAAARERSVVLVPGQVFGGM